MRAPPQLLMMLAEKQPSMLEQTGLTREFIEKQMEQLEKFSRLSELSPEDKQKADHAKWEGWLEKFKERLGKVRGAGWPSV